MFRNFTIYKIIKESSTIKSFFLKRTDNTIIEDYQPGQFITISIKPSNFKQDLIRNYTLSDTPGNDYFRITVKKENYGKASKYLHDNIKVGDTIEASKPLGDFSLTTRSEKPVVLLSGGVGITPMLSMLEYILKKEKSRGVFFLHSSHDKTVQPMFERLRKINMENENVFVSIFHTSPNPSEQQFLDYDVKGIISKDYLKKTLPKRDMDYFLCGPTSFMEAMYAHLLSFKIPKDAIHYEFFGEGKPLGNIPTFSDSNTNDYKVNFTKSNKTVAWSDNSTSILELAESVGIMPDNSCRMGTCSTCESTLIKGTTQYNPEPFMETASGKILICCSKPKTDIEIEL